MGVHMNQDEAWQVVVEALKLQYLQRNSHIPNIKEWIDERVVETIEAIRNTPKSIETESKIKK